MGVSGLGVLGSRLWLRARGAGFWARGSGWWDPGAGCWVLASGFWAWGLGRPIEGDAQSHPPLTVSSGRPTRDPRRLGRAPPRLPTNRQARPPGLEPPLAGDAVVRGGAVGPPAEGELEAVVRTTVRDVRREAGYARRLAARSDDPLRLAAARARHACVTEGFFRPAPWWIETGGARRPGTRPPVRS